MMYCDVPPAVLEALAVVEPADVPDGVPPWVERVCEEYMKHECQPGQAGENFTVLEKAVNIVTPWLGKIPRSWDFGEFCSGRGRTTATLRAHGLKGWSFDKLTRDTSEDLAKLPGLVWAAIVVIGSREFGLAQFTPDCATWITMSRSHTKRSNDNVHGDTARADVTEQNLVAQHMYPVGSTYYTKELHTRPHTVQLLLA